MKYKLYGTSRIPKDKAATFNYKAYETESIDELVGYVNTHAILPCAVDKGHRKKDNVKEIYNWIRLDVDVEGEAEKIDVALKDMMYIKKPSTSHAKYPYKWHYLIPIEGVSQDYDEYKLQYAQFLNDFNIDLKDTSLSSVVQNTNPMKGKAGIALTEVNKGGVWTASKMKIKKRLGLEKTHSNVTKASVKSALDKVGFEQGDYDSTYKKWLVVGMALYDWCPKRGFKLWDKWSRLDGDSYDGSTNKKWDDFANSMTGDVTIGTLMHLAYGDKVDVDEVFGGDDGALVIVNSKEKKKSSSEVLKEEIKEIEREKGNIEYPPSLFPVSIRDYMQETTSMLGLNFSASVPYTMIMLSQLLGDRVKIRMAGAWTHTPIIWGLNIAGAGVGKSPLMKKLSFPLWDIQKRRKKKHEEESKDYQYDIHLHNKALKAGDATPEDEPEKPVLSMVIMDEFTVESLYDQLESDDGVMVWKDELKGLFIQNEKTDILRTKMISAWSGQSIIRNTKTQGANILIDPYVRVGGNVQPEVVKQILRDNKSGFNADGFIVRFQLIAHLKKVRSVWGDDSIDEGINPFSQNSFGEVCDRLARATKEKMLTLSAEADRVLRAYMRTVEVSVEEATSNFEQEFISKIGSLLGSIIVILHELEAKKKNTVVSADTVEKAIAITEVARDNATYLYSTEKREVFEAESAEEHIEEWLASSTGKKHLGKKGQNMGVSGFVRYLNNKVNNKQILDYFEASKNFRVLKQGRGFKITKS